MAEQKKQHFAPAFADVLTFPYLAVLYSDNCKSMKRSILVFCISLLSLCAEAQPYSIGSTTITFTDPSRGNRAIETDVYYPATANGANTPLGGSSTTRFPVIAFGHGFVMTVGAYQNIWSALVPQGYIVALPKTEGSLAPNHTNFGKDLAYVIAALKTNGNTSGNFFFNRIAAPSAVMGHSMGGGAAFLALQYSTQISAVIGLAPAETNPAASTAAGTSTLPALVFAGANDCVTPAAQHSGLIYNTSTSACKQYVNIIGGSHCQFANSNFNCSFGESTCAPGPSISRSTQQNIFNTYLLPWLKFRLNADCQGWYQFQSLASADPAITLTQTCGTAVSCTAPVNRLSTSITTTSALVKWKAPACVSTYELRYRASGTSTWTIVPGLSTVSYTLNNLSAGTTYEWQVRTRCNSTGTANSSWGTLKSFTTASARFGNGMGDRMDAEEISDFQVQPNPNNGIFRLQFESQPESDVQVQIIDMLGKRKFSKTLSSHEESTLRLQLPPGIYFVAVSNGGSIQTRRMIVQ